jgi:hypothetical protein
MEDGGRAAAGTLLRHFRLEAGLSRELAERAQVSMTLERTLEEARAAHPAAAR